MKSGSAPILVVLLLVLLGIGGALGNKLTYLRESEAFYRWILAAATNDRLFQDEAGEYNDDELFQAVDAVAQKELSDIQTPSQAEGDVTKTLTRAAAHSENEWAIWKLASGPSTEKEREIFLASARDRKLQFATGIAYADAQASGVNVFNLFFGFKKVAANMVWLNVDRYWHQGALHLMIPLMRTCVMLDPNFIDAYLLGAWHISYNATAKMSPTPAALQKWNANFKACVGPREELYYIAIDFLKDGIRNNPRNYKLYFDLGFAIYYVKMEDYENAVRYLREAVRIPHDRWVPRMLYQSLEKNGQYEEALAGWQDYIQRFPEATSATETAPRFIARNRGLIFERQGSEARKAAKAATDPAVKAQKEAEAKAAFEEARKIWASMSDPYAEARLYMIEAEELVAQDRALEALALLDQARWQANDIWETASNRIITVKQEFNLPLSVSEQKAVLRNEVSSVDCPGKPKAS